VQSVSEAVPAALYAVPARTEIAITTHNAKDKPRVRRLAERLKAAGVRVWLDEWVIQAGDPANAVRRFIPLLLGDCALTNALRRCKVVDFREESEAAFPDVQAALPAPMLPKLLSAESSMATTVVSPAPG
jgi:hypothetical protein